ncbi:MAG: methyltransferase, partial [Candidatus Sabulitectum sp.]|nr:methyltransferase [Candidatus Sabulitectum sp.]
MRSAYFLFFLHHKISEKEAIDLLGLDLYESLIIEGLLINSDGIISNVRFVPWSNFLFVSDHDEGSSRETDFYVYVGGDSTELISFVNRRLDISETFHRGLDLCAGTSIQSYNLLNRCDSIVAAEISQRAIDYAAVSSEINSPGKINIVKSDLWQNLEGTFDIIISNPPYVPARLNEVSPKILDAYGGSDLGMDIPIKI